MSALLRSCCATLLDSVRTLSFTCTTSLLYTEGTLLSSIGLSLVCDEHLIWGAGLAEGAA